MEVEGVAIAASGHKTAAAAANLNRRMKTLDFTRSSLSLIQETFEFKKQTILMHAATLHRIRISTRILPLTSLCVKTKYS
jgi:hypothetical protein